MQALSHGTRGKRCGKTGKLMGGLSPAGIEPPQLHQGVRRADEPDGAFDRHGLESGGGGGKEASAGRDLAARP